MKNLVLFQTLISMTLLSLHQKHFANDIYLDYYTFTFKLYDPYISNILPMTSFIFLSILCLAMTAVNVLQFMCLQLLNI